MAISVLTSSSERVQGTQAPTRARATAIPWLVVSVLFAATSVVIGVIWDISWHMTIGRDSFWTPAHMAIYLGGAVGGVASGIHVLRLTFAGTQQEKDSAVRFWGFRGPLGAWVSIWGAFAMITSAPFDDWWHNAYGLDVEILSPPHVVLALGMVALATGAMLVTLALQNRQRADEARGIYPWLYAYAAACVLQFLTIMLTEYSDPILQHTSTFYRLSGGVYVFFLVAAGMGSRLRWGTTAIAGFYMLARALINWTLMLFPAVPKLGPIYQPVDHMVPMDFPLLLIVPAIAMDLVRQRTPDSNDWARGVLLGLTFFVVFLMAQWGFAYFLMSPASANYIFHTDRFPYMVPQGSYMVRREFVPWDASESSMRAGLFAGAAITALSSLIGTAWGKWMRRVQR